MLDYKQWCFITCQIIISYFYYSSANNIEVMKGEVK